MGWLKLGLNGPGSSCGWTNSLGMVDDGGCDNDRGFLQSQIWPDPDTHGCCTAVGLGGEDKIGAEVSNKWADLSHYMNPPIPVWVPIYKDDPLQPIGTGQNAYYDIVGFGAIVFLGQSGEQEHSKWLKGAAIETPWCAVTDPDGTKHDYCAGPGSSFKFGVTGEVQLRR